ncbi:MAG: bacteriophage holin [Armatimonadota bacterium]
MMMRLNVKAFTVACGLIWGFGVLAFTWWRLIFESRGEDDTILGHIYRGYELTPIGSLIGFVWALFDGAAGGLTFSWLYNKLADRIPMKIEL